jgi:hypothetical protein
MKKNLCIVLMNILSLLFFIYSLNAQAIVQVKAQIENSLLTYMNGKYELCGNIICVDSAKNEKRADFQKIADPYNTLHECYLFIAKTQNEDDEKFAVGIYKNNSIIWMTDSLDGNYSFGQVEAVFDINRDGFVEIVMSFQQKLPLTDSDIWIIGWNGVTGRVIDHLSTYCILKDVDGDGIYEFLGEGAENDEQGNYKSPKKLIYIWNGSEYVIGSNITEKKMTVANNLTSSIRMNVVKLLDTLKYTYSLTNNSSSMQSVKYVFINDSVSYATGTAPQGWQYGHRINPSFSCYIAVGNTSLKNGLTLDSLVIKSTGLPNISNYYAQAEFSPINFSLSDTSIFGEMIIRNIYINSYIGKTIGPADPPSLFAPLNFIDTLSYYTAQSHTFGWIKDQATTDKYLGYFSSSRTKLVQRDSVGSRNILLQVLKDVDIDSTASLSSEAYALLRFNTEYLANRLPQAQAAPFFAVKLVSSNGTKLTSGTLQYYEGAWKDATNNQDGTFSINTSLKTLSLRMTYEYGTQTKSNVSISNDTIVFQTINAQIQLQNSSGNLIDTGSVQYYAGAWRILGTTINGVASKELLSGNYTFRMTYAYASKDKQQDIGTSSTVIFQTVNANVRLQNSQGNPIDQGTVQYYSGAWRDFGNTANGIALKELLPNSYTFRMTYAFASKDNPQDLNSNTVVVFQTVKSTVQLQNSQGNFIDQGTVQYYSGAWRDFGTTTNGISTKELLPNNYTFRMTYAFSSNDKQQDVSTNNTVTFSTVNAIVQLRNSQGVLIDQGTVQYYSGAWRDFGTTANGIAAKELLPNNYTFKITYAFASNDKQQNIGTNATVLFKTVNAIVQLLNSQGNPIDQGAVQYYSGAWRNLGTTTNGVASKELLPNSYSFRMTYEFVTNDKTQDILTNSTVSFSTVLCTVRVKDAQNQLVNNAQASYYSGAWRVIGKTVNGEVTKELLPTNLSFRVKYNTTQKDKTQNLSTNNVVEFSLP